MASRGYDLWPSQNSQRAVYMPPHQLEGPEELFSSSYSFKLNLIHHIKLFQCDRMKLYDIAVRR